jgi:ABC-type tungstate transport system substrate-binding protein
MPTNGSSRNGSEAEPRRQRVPLPVGYRQGIISAITVVLGFSLLFLRFWSFELPGEWNVSSVAGAILMGFAILGLTVTLWRSLQVEDDDEPEYKKTLRWFQASTILLLISVTISALSFSSVLKF